MYQRHRSELSDLHLRT